MMQQTTRHAPDHARSARTVRLVAAVLAVTAVTIASELRAGSGGFVELPTSSTNIAHGLQLTVDTRWAGGYGYRPVRFRIDAAPSGRKAKRDRVLRVELTPKDIHHDYQTTVTQFLELPEGNASAEATVLVPVEGEWHHLRIHVYEDGQVLSEFSNLDLASSGLSGEPEKVAVGSLFVSRQAPRLRDRQKWLPELRNSHRLTFRRATSDALFERGSAHPDNDRAILDYYDERIDAELVHPADLPETWLGLTEIDLMHVSLADLRIMKDAYPGQLTAVQRWLATGTTLWISDEGWQSEAAEEVESILELGTPREDEPPAEEPEPSLVDRFPAAELRRDDWTFPQSTACAARRFGCGTVVVGKPEMTREEQWAVLSSLTDSTKQSSLFWGMRHGVVPREGDSFFDSWLIPGAGEPPVTAFRLLITLFVLVIGPLNIWLVRRVRRTYLIMLTIPAAAVLVTTVLLAYAAVRDGFGVQARVRSYTFIDQQAGLTVSVSRQTYFASILPAEGMVYPADTAVYPLESRHDRQWSNVRRIDWRGDEQRLAEGYLPSRQTAQFIVFDSRRDTPSRLEVTVAEDVGRIRAVNRLGTQIHQLMLVDAKGGFHWAEDIADGEAADLRSVTFAAASRELQAVIDANPLGETEYSRFTGNPGYIRQQWLYEVNSSHGVLESSLADCRVPDAIPGTYVAITATSPVTPLGAEAAQTGSFHVMAGRW